VDYCGLDTDALSHYEVEIHEFLRHDRVITAPFAHSDIDESEVPS
jgi:hypothetical protein